MSANSERGPGLGSSLLGALLVVALLSWALLAPTAARGRSSRPPLLTPVALDFINEASAPPAAPSVAEVSRAAPSRDGLRPW